MERNINVKQVEGAQGSCLTTADEGGRGCRNKKKLQEPICCPVCCVTVRISEVQSHLMFELDKLAKISSSKHRQNGRNGSGPSSSSSGHASPSDKTWEAFQKVKSNRQNRQRTKSRKRKCEQVLCPICNKETTEEITLHVERCLRRTNDNSGSGSDESIDVEAFEEYEWAGQSRVRITSLLPGGVVNLGTSITMADDDEDLNVDGDDTQTYGSPQYSERDIILLPADPENVALRKAVVGEDTKKCQSHQEPFTASLHGDPLVQVLKNRIRELESRSRNKEEVYKCLICMERYKTPVISVCCWHVHCEQCWLQTLGAKKLCPQCNMITSPADLRKIYM